MNNTTSNGKTVEIKECMCRTGCVYKQARTIAAPVETTPADTRCTYSGMAEYDQATPFLGISGASA